LLQALEAQGFCLEAEGDRLHVRPADRLTPGLREEIRTAKGGLLRLLAERRSAGGGVMFSPPLPQSATSARSAEAPSTATEQVGLAEADDAFILAAVEKDQRLRPGSLRLWAAPHERVTT
jgi:hypothetical protein